LSVETPERVPGWDAIILTAANQHQARLYELQLDAARKRGLISERTRTMVAADPDGMRIGSGGATLNALKHLSEILPGSDPGQSRVLLIHAGGDSRRAPWANLFGKCFIPFPLFADPDRAVPTIFDHQLAITASFARRMKNGGLLTLSGDVVPLLAVSRVHVPDDGGLVVTVPASLDVAERHGVIVADAEGNVTKLVQKASAEKLVEEGALVAGGAALLDTGIYMFTGDTYRSLQTLAKSAQDPVQELLDSGGQCSVYEEIAGALVPSQHEWLLDRPLGKNLLEALGGGSLVHHQADELTFIHFGSSSEVLQHFGDLWEGRFSRRILSEGGSAVSPSAVLCASLLHPSVSVGEGSIIYGCRLGSHINVGNRCVMVGVDTDAPSFKLPDNTCLWQVPVIAGDGRSGTGVVSACCGVDDNPKLSRDSGTFCNRSMDLWLAEHQVQDSDLWQGEEERILWNARLFPEGADSDGLSFASWMLGPGGQESDIRDAWLKSSRLSFASLSRQLDVARHAD
jgi:fucokinase